MNSLPSPDVKQDKDDTLPPASSERNIAQTEKGLSTGIVVTVILTVALFYFASSIIVPLAFSLFCIALVWPLQAMLQRWLPRLLALLTTLCVTIVVVVAVGSSVAWGFGRLAQWLFVNAARFQAIYQSWTAWLEKSGIFIVGPLTDRFDVAWLLGFTQTVAGKLNSIAGFLVLVFIFVMIGLLEVESFNRRLLSPAVQPMGKRILKANREIAAKLRRFMIVRTFASVLTGLVVWVFAFTAGLELAAAWGAIAFALNYIPFLGPLIATVFPTLFAIAQFESWQMAVIVFVSLNVIQFAIGSYIEPLLTGASLSISPFAVVFSVFFWSLVWGLSGAFIGVPILIVFIVYCAQQPSTRWIALLLSGNAAVGDDVTGRNS